MKLLCPLDHSKGRGGAEGEEEEKNGRKRRRDESARGNNLQPPFAHTVSLGGRRVLLCNFNGIMFQVEREGGGEETSKWLVGWDGRRNGGRKCVA